MVKLLCSFLLLFAVLLVTPAITYAQQPASYKALVAEIGKLVNQHRAAIGRGPLQMNEVMSQAAEQHSRNMGSGRVRFGHDGFDERMAGIKKTVKPAHAWAENVAFGPDDAREIVDMWLHSSGHKKNIEGDYNLTGIGMAKGKDGSYYYTQIFFNKD